MYFQPTNTWRVWWVIEPYPVDIMLRSHLWRYGFYIFLPLISQMLSFSNYFSHYPLCSYPHLFLKSTHLKLYSLKTLSCLVLYILHIIDNISRSKGANQILMFTQYWLAELGLGTRSYHFSTCSYHSFSWTISWNSYLQYGVLH